MRISVLGTGYLGATHAAALSALGHDVVGVDTDERRVQLLRQGLAPFHEPGLGHLLHRGVTGGGLRFTTDVADAAGWADVHFLCVGTPQRAGSHAADLRHLWAAVGGLAPRLRKEALVVGKSTVPVGTAARVRDVMRAQTTCSVRVAWNPEFLREGHAVDDSLRPDRLVLGVDTDEAYATLCDLYAPIIAAGIPCVRTDLETAELAKVAANAMLATRVSLVNLLAEVCEAAGADVGRLIEIIGHDSRIGHRFLHPGVGYGGGCLPKDTRAFAARAQELGVGEAATVLHEVDALNMRQRARTVDRAVALLGGSPQGRPVAVLGAAFKADSDDVRDSPALDIACTLSALGAQVRVHDPRAGDNVRRVQPLLEVHETIESACAAVELVLVLTEWEEFRTIDPVALLDVVAEPVVLDGRLLLDPDKWRGAGWRFHALGRGEP